MNGSVILSSNGSNAESATAAAIRKLLEGYVEAPLKYLREINLQAQLRQLLIDELKIRMMSVDTLTTVSSCGTGRLNAVESTSETSRVQLEMKVQTPELASKERSDLVLLKATGVRIQLKRGRRGPLDVTSYVASSGVDAVVEMKAACSADPEQRHLFRRDVEKLQALLAHEQQLEAHFVLIDKSLALGPHTYDFGPQAKEDWETGSPGGRQLKVRRDGQSVTEVECSPQLKLEEATAEVCVHEGRQPVHVWDLSRNGSVRHRLCSAICHPNEDQINALGIVRKAKSPTDE